MPNTSKEHPLYEPVAWSFTAQRIGAALRDLYAAPAEPPREMLRLIERIDAKSDQ